MDPEPECLLQIRKRAVAFVCPGQEAGQDRTEQDERQARQQKARPACAEIAELDRHLGRVRTGDEVRESDQVEELVAAYPGSTANDLVLH
jgi:hypothetical protein